MLSNLRTVINLKDKIVFKNTNDTSYIAIIDEELFIKFITDIVTSFTICDANAFSAIMDIPISEELIARTIADAFVASNLNDVLSSSTGVIISYSLSEINYKITIANNVDKLGGIVYGIIT